MQHLPALRSTSSATATRISPEEVSARLDQYARLSQGAFSPNTLRAIRADTAVFQAWAEGAGVSGALPLDPETVAAFVVAMGETRKPATVSRYLSSLDHLHRAADLPPVGGTNPVRLAKRRLNRAKGTAQDQAKPMRRETVDRALARLGDSLPELRDAALIALAYDTYARASELVALDVQDVTQDVDGATCLIRRSKTDQEGEGKTRYVAPDTFQRVAAWVQAARLDPGDPLFPPLSAAGRSERISVRDVSRIYQRRVGERYSAHSTRVGAAVDARAAGLGTGDIASSGGWKSERMVLRYTAGLEAQESAAAKLARMQGRA